FVAGQRTELGLQARVTVADGAAVTTRQVKRAVPGITPEETFVRHPNGPVVILDNFPPYISTDDIVMNIDKRAKDKSWHHRHPELAAQTGLPIRDLYDFSSCDDYWFVSIPTSGTPPEALRDQLLKVYGVTIWVSVGLPKSLPKVIRTWARTHQHEDLQASLTALESALVTRRKRL